MCDYKRSFGLENEFIGHFNTRLLNTLHYNTIADLNTLQITTAYAKSFPAYSVFTTPFLITASNSGYSSTAPSLLFAYSLTIDCLSYN
jgi:hypothetical protein